jgi:hypothetical protein
MTARWPSGGGMEARAEVAKCAAKAWTAPYSTAQSIPSIASSSPPRYLTIGTISVVWISSSVGSIFAPVDEALSASKLIVAIRRCVRPLPCQHIGYLPEVEINRDEKVINRTFPQ